jgi:hypothetical protein
MEGLEIPKKLISITQGYTKEIKMQSGNAKQ